MVQCKVQVIKFSVIVVLFEHLQDKHTITDLKFLLSQHKI